MAIRLHDVLDDLRGTTGGSELAEEYYPVLLKAMLAHGADWRTGSDLVERALSDAVTSRTARGIVSRFLGYGRADGAKAMACTDGRATVLGFGKLSDDEAHLYRLPLPPSLAGRLDRRRLTVTLGWMSPISPESRRYRTAALWFDIPAEDAGTLAVVRSGADWQAARRGTLQHEVFDGGKAAAFVDGDLLSVKVNCRKDASDLTVPVRYGLVVSLEVYGDVAIPIYDEIRTRIRLPVPIRTVAANG
jgi:hypothetical protein